MSEIRYNRLEDNYVIIAPERLHRPDYMSWSKEEQSVTSCPFCEGNEEMTPSEIYAIRENGSFADEKGWSARVVPNLYKAVQIEAPYLLKSIGANKVWEGFGAHEIIIDTPEHLNSLSKWSQKTFFHWFKTIQARTQDLKKDERIAYISVFKNHGPSAGATQPHPHTQLIGLPMVPREIVRKYERMYSYYMNSGNILMDEILEEEKRDKKRIVIKTESFIAFCPFASEYPFEVMIASDKISSELETIRDTQIKELSALLQELFIKMERELGNFDFNMSICVAPMKKHFDVDVTCRFTIRIMPRIYRHGGFELSTSTMINPIEPEKSAKLLRGVYDEY
ncbi:galactose-1-phosphate uridylyltransferase [bacterium]|nr:galactose-1-phosphate uridylyltransferase [bacterium]MBU1993677.1 galactose-1-phosphate uridylyltransferase [bacterium]